MTESNIPELEHIRQAAREVIEKGSEVRDQIRTITLSALKTGRLELSASKVWSRRWERVP